MRTEFPPFESERDEARRIKQDTIEHLDEYLIALKAKLEANGCIVFFAADAAQAREYILDVAKKNQVKRVVKGKSMTTEEIGLNNR